MSVMTTTEPGAPATPRDPAAAGWRAAFLDELRRTAARDRWGLALIVAGWVHLGAFLACQAIYVPGVNRDGRHLAFWVADLVATLAVFRLVCGKGWYRASPAAGLLVRVWGTFFILAFNLVMANVLTGWAIHWYRLVWPTVSTFGFATTAWLVSPWFLVPAVQMYLTGMLMIWVTHWNYAIYGVSWWAALQVIGWVVMRRCGRGR
jgi:hypothetical protein